MARVVVDANVLIAARLQRDSDHERGHRLATAFDQGRLPPAVVLSDVLQEVCNYLRETAGHEVAVETLDAIIESRGFELAVTTQADLDAGRSLFRRYEPLSLTDSVIAAFCDRADIEYLYSFDGGFDAVSGLTRLATPDDPFAPE